MGRTKKVDNESIASFIENTNSRFEGQRNTLNFMKKLGNVDASEVIANAAEKEVSFVMDRMDALYKIRQGEEDVSEATITYIKEAVTELYRLVMEDITFNNFDSKALSDKLTMKYEDFIAKL